MTGARATALIARIVTSSVAHLYHRWCARSEANYIRACNVDALLEPGARDRFLAAESAYSCAATSAAADRDQALAELRETINRPSRPQEM